jgi:prepilin-type N-terminal cleavage/methylation domain-containing protein
MKNIRKFFSNREHGFSLLEMSIAVGIMAIGLVIALPNFTNAIQTQQANDVKNNLIQSGMILEQARFANDGSYPTQSTMPTEISSNAKYSAFTYTTDSASQRYCIMGRDSVGQKYYISSDAPSVVYTPTEANPSCSGVVCISPDQTNCPKSPVISTPSVTGSNTWSITTQPAALANMSWGTSSCAWSGSAPTNAGPISGVDYQVRVIQTPSGAILNAFNGSYTSTNSLTGFSLDNLAPGTSIQYQVRARCLADYEYYYTAWSYVSDTVARFPLTKPATPTATTSWPAGQAYGTASFTIAAITCPSASYTPVYQATLTQTDGQAVIHTIKAPATSSNSG